MYMYMYVHVHMQLPVLKEKIGSLCLSGGELSHSDPSTHHDLVKKELDQLHQHVGIT